MARIDFNAEEHPPWDWDTMAEPTSEYAEWLLACKFMDEEKERARVRWQGARIEMQEKLSEMRAHVESLRAQYRRLDLRPKPEQPKSSRRGGRNEHDGNVEA